MQFTFNDILKLLPELMLTLLALLIIFGELFGGDANEEQRFSEAASTTVLGFGMIFVVVLLQSGYIIDRIVDPTLDPALVTQPVGRVLLGLLRNLQSAQGTTLLNNALIVDDLMMVARLLFIAAGMMVALLVQDGKRVQHGAEFFGLLVLSVVGLNLMAGAGELVTIYLALELASVTLYVLTRFGRTTADARSLTYPLFGMVSSAVLLYGFSFLYGYSALSGTPNTTSIPAIAQTITQGGVSPLMIVATALVIVGLSYKIAVVPFHAWTVRTFEHTSPAVTALLSTASIAAAFILLFRVVGLGLQPLVGSVSLAPGFGGWSSILAVIAVITMVVGNFGALRTRDARSVLTHTAIAHAGFLLIAVIGAYSFTTQGQVAWTEFGVRSLIYYLIAYVVTTLGAWGVLTALANGNSDPGAVGGLARRNYGLALLLVIFLLSLAGVPPLGGFWARFFVLAAGWETNAAWLVIVGAVTMLLSALAYFRLIGAIFSGSSGDDAPLVVGRTTRVALVVAAVVVVVIGVFPSLFLPLVQTGAQTAGLP